MNILVYGAGVIGSVYAAKLRIGGHQVTLLARDARLADIRQYGLVLEDMVGGKRSTTQVNTTAQLTTEDDYDLAIIAVRRDQLADIMPGLAANRRIPLILFMLNNPLGSASLVESLGKDRVMLGFPGTGGTREGYIIRYALIKQQPTTLAEVNGQQTARLRDVARVFRESGFPVAISRDMDSWLMTHAFFVTAVSGAIYLAGGDCRKLSENGATLTLMTKGVREGFLEVRSLGKTVTPFSLMLLFTWMPQAIPVFYWRRFFASAISDCVFGGHARCAAKEMREIAMDCRTLLERTGVRAPALGQLYQAIDLYVEKHAR